MYVIDPIICLRKLTFPLQISNCSGFKTLAHAETKFSMGMRSTGVGMALCARHEVVRAGGVGDLQKGERYGILSHINYRNLHVTADIATWITYFSQL